ncbi:hypothetical protein ALP05_04288 [Pseudomonas caricapapayae]|uniref:Uncharacterized protein n=1 Tax=Pseudomonas caricapapayae TaxID=46678 RepID=A0A3M6EZP0_9PSED|nr:hypothetical protein [Pseudomonas caricapapayae]RMV73054.1 hypothetical protein ALP05_04288 [Pseudomonas caricapapayae]
MKIHACTSALSIIKTSIVDITEASFTLAAEQHLTPFRIHTIR